MRVLDGRPDVRLGVETDTSHSVLGVTERVQEYVRWRGEPLEIVQIPLGIEAPPGRSSVIAGCHPTSISDDIGTSAWTGGWCQDCSLNRGDEGRL